VNGRGPEGAEPPRIIKNRYQSFQNKNSSGTKNFFGSYLKILKSVVYKIGKA
jgi:hypothetical protein